VFTTLDAESARHYQLKKPQHINIVKLAVSYGRERRRTLKN